MKKRTFIFLSCLLSMTLLQAEPLMAGCGCGKKKPKHHKQFCQDIHFNGCGCGGGGGTGSNEIPPDNG